MGSASTPSLAISNNTISITNGAPYSQTKISFLLFQQDSNSNSIIALTNQTGSLQIATKYNNGTIIDSNSSVTVSILPGNLNSKESLIYYIDLYIGMTIQPYSLLTSVVSSLILTLPPPDFITTNGTLLMKFPTINSLAPSAQQRSMLYGLNACIRNPEVLRLLETKIS